MERGYYITPNTAEITELTRKKITNYLDPNTTLNFEEILGSWDFGDFYDPALQPFEAWASEIDPDLVTAPSFTYPLPEFYPAWTDQSTVGPSSSSDISQTPTASPIPPATESLSSPSPSRPYPCSVCAQSFDKRHKLNRHMQLHDKPISCPICDHRTAKNRDMKRHVNVRHTNDEIPQSYLSKDRYPCPVVECKYAKEGFKRKDHLSRHLRRKHRGLLH
ncbi:hypothetical protein OIDMADRAFT_148968 [Oidiodendron maius Zn]|uniref:C2H2-type domain-containing protein n=1 Tax=Oidiodendron maius (strain Zn) TaxID=913774 RepID=A0A0C3GGV3_OIDMZ|nr:hypothetical protein OIDMADRAFT_148968 [Oidiodendron maius Zn]